MCIRRTRDTIVHLNEFWQANKLLSSARLLGKRRCANSYSGDTFQLHFTFPI